MLRFHQYENHKSSQVLHALTLGGIKWFVGIAKEAKTLCAVAGQRVRIQARCLFATVRFRDHFHVGRLRIDYDNERHEIETSVGKVKNCGVSEQRLTSTSQIGQRLKR